MNAREIGEAIGIALGRIVKALGLGDAVRAHYAAKYGTCRRCDEVLGGASPEQICEGCHAGELMGVVLGGGTGGDA